MGFSAVSIDVVVPLAISPHLEKALTTYLLISSKCLKTPHSTILPLRDFLILLPPLRLLFFVHDHVRINNQLFSPPFNRRRATTPRYYLIFVSTSLACS